MLVKWKLICISLVKIVIPDSVTYIGKSAFDDCHKLVKVVIPNSVTYIEYYAFYGCYDLTSVTMPKLFEPQKGNIFGYNYIEFTYT